MFVVGSDSFYRLVSKYLIDYVLRSDGNAINYYLFYVKLKNAAAGSNLSYGILFSTVLYCNVLLGAPRLYCKNISFILQFE